MAAQAMGFESHAVYPTCSGRRIASHLALAGTRVAFVENVEQAGKLLGSSERLPRLERVVVFDERGLRELNDARVVGLGEFSGTTNASAQGLFEQRIANGQGSDIAFLVVTAGSTGAP